MRAAILLLLSEKPQHGYQLMQAITERTGGVWHPSPGAIYPTIAQLEDEGLVVVHIDQDRRLVRLSAAGRKHLKDATPSDPFAEFANITAGPNLRESMDQLHGAARQIAVSGSASQIETAEQVLAAARRSLYLILAGETPPEIGKQQ